MQLLPGRLAGAHAASPQLLGGAPRFASTLAVLPCLGTGHGELGARGGCPAPQHHFGVLLLSSILSGAQEPPPVLRRVTKRRVLWRNRGDFRVLEGVWESRRSLRLRCAEAVGLRAPEGEPKAAERFCQKETTALTKAVAVPFHFPPQKKKAGRGEEQLGEPFVLPRVHPGVPSGAVHPWGAAGQPRAGSSVINN